MKIKISVAFIILSTILLEGCQENKTPIIKESTGINFAVTDENSNTPEI